MSTYKGKEIKKKPSNSEEENILDESAVTFHLPNHQEQQDPLIFSREESKLDPEVSSNKAGFFCKLPEDTQLKITEITGLIDTAKAASTSRDFKALAEKNPDYAAILRGQKLLRETTDQQLFDIGDQYKGQRTWTLSSMPFVRSQLSVQNLYAALGKNPPLMTLNQYLEFYRKTCSSGIHRDILSDNSLEALKERLITMEEVNSLNVANLSKILSHNGLTALREKLITIPQIKAHEVNMVDGGNEAILYMKLSLLLNHPNGLTALRNKLIDIDAELADLRVESAESLEQRLTDINNVAATYGVQPSP